MSLPSLRALAFAAVALLEGCQTASPFRSAWYLQNESEGPTMLIALVNEGSAPVRVTKLVLNPEAEEVSTGWQHTFDNEGWNFQTGTFLILRARDFKDAANNPFEGCRIPVRMAVIRSKPSDVSWVVMSGAMPTYLHLDMLKCLK